MLNNANVRVLMPVYGYAPDDPRVILEGSLAQELGYDVIAVGVNLRDQTQNNQLKFELVPVVNNYNPFHILRGIWNVIIGNPQKNTNQLQKSNILAILFFNLWVIRLGLKYKPHIIHCHEHQGLLAGWFLAKILRAKWIYDSHECVPENRIGKGQKATFAIGIEKTFLSRVDKVITVGERLAKDLRNRGAKDVTVIGNWKRIEDYQISAEYIAQLRAKLSLDQYKLIITYIGSLQPTRDIKPLLDAVSQCMDVALVIGGRGPLQNMVEEYSSEYDNIKYIGWVNLEDVPKYTMIGDIIYYCINQVSGNSYYSTPNKLFESFAANKPMIARRNIGEIGEILEQTQSAVLIEEATSENLQSVFHQLLHNEFKQKLEKGTEKAQHKYNTDVASELLKILYQDLLESEM